MELQFEKRELSCLFQAVRGVKELELTQEIRLTESMPDVGRVLAGWGQVILRGKEWIGNQIGVSGGVMVWALYAPEDGTEPRVVDGWIPFQMKWDGAEAEREGPVRILPVLRFVDGRNLSARKILLRAGVCCMAEGYFEKRTAVCSPGEVPADVELLRRCYPMCLPSEAGEKTFSLEETLDMGGRAVLQTISFSLRPEVTECRVSGGKAVVQGFGRLHMVYLCTEGRICAGDFDIPFSQLIELDQNRDADARMDVVMAVTGLEVETGEADPVLRASLVAQYMLHEPVMLELVEDAYSSCREVGIRQEELYLPALLDRTQERVSVQEMIRDRIMDTADTVIWPGLPAVSRSGGCVDIEIPARFQVLGRDENGELRGSSGSWTGRVSLGADETSRVDALPHALGGIHTLSTGSGMELRADMEVATATMARRGMLMITGLELGQLRPADPQRPSLVLCRAGNRSLWDIARDTGSSISAIRAVNSLEQEPGEGRMLLIPVS